MASYGYLGLCYESTQTGSGEPCTTAVRDAIARYGNAVYADRILSTGHSQGGGASHTCQFLLEQANPRASVVSVGIQPAHGMNRPGYVREYPQIRGPVFMFSGTRDGVVSSAWVGRGFAIVESEKYFYEAVGASHFNPHNWANTSVLSFGEWKLAGDERAGAWFRDLPNNPRYWRER